MKKRNLQTNIEKIYVKALGLKHITNSECNLLYADIKQYKGKEIVVGNTTIKKGDTVIEFHIDNLNILSFDGSYKSIIKSFRKEMKSLYEAIQDVDEYSDVKAAYAITILHPLLRSLGFVSFPLKSKIYSTYLRFWENRLRNMFSQIKKKSSKKRQPMKCWIALETIKIQAQKAERS